MLQQKLFFAGGPHHFNRRLIAIHEDLAGRVEQKNRIRAPFKQLLKHVPIVEHRHVPRTGSFVPVARGIL